MMKQTVSLACSVAALVIATLGSTPLGDAAGKAASQIVPRNSVGTLQLKRNAVTSSKLAPNTVRTGQVVDGSLLTADFKAGQIPQGPKGDKGDKGDRGPVGINGYEMVRTQRSLAAGASTVYSAVCPKGKSVLGGGAFWQGVPQGLAMIHTNVTSTGGGVPDAWQISSKNTSTATQTLTAVAICAKVAG
jgi:hypothetical protein